MRNRGAFATSIAEMREFGSFEASTQRYVRRSLDVAAGRSDVLARWARDRAEAAHVTAQMDVYRRVPLVRELLPGDVGPLSGEPVMSPLVAMAGFDLAYGRLPTFGAFRFLYERLLGGDARPWLPSAFMAAAGLPHLRPAVRGALLKSISENAATAPAWSRRPPAFFPVWVDEVGADA